MKKATVEGEVLRCLASSVVVVVLLGALLFFGFASVLAVVIYLAQTRQPPPSPTTPTPPVASPMNPGQSSDEDWKAYRVRDRCPYEVGSSNEMDLGDLARQAYALAKDYDSAPQLNTIYATNVKNGLVDVTKTSTSFKFDWYREDPAHQKPIRGQVEIRAFPKELVVTSWYKKWGEKREGPGVPACYSRSAWQAVVASGVLTEGVATFSYWRTGPSGVWAVVVKEGDYHFSLDGRTCEMIEGRRKSKSFVRNRKQVR